MNWNQNTYQGYDPKHSSSEYSK